MDQIREDLREIKRNVNEIRVDVAKNTVSLDQHIKRTEIAERRLEKLEYALIGLLVVAVFGGIIKLLITS